MNSYSSAAKWFASKTALLLALCAFVPAAFAATTIDSANRHAYGANLGWLDWRGDTANGAVIGEYVCSGSIYAANAGWIGLGSGVPANGIQYQNNSAGDFGVNRDGVGNLRGHAWGANIGWIHFESVGAPRVDLITGNLNGHAWSANCGWISLSNAVAYVQTDSIAPGVDSDGDGIADSFEHRWFGNLGTANATSDFDGDGRSDKNEYLAGSNPTAYTVTTIADSGIGSLRHAILTANAKAGQDMIEFRGLGAGQPIVPLSPLPTITGPLTIDGLVSPGGSGFAAAGALGLGITLNGTAAGPGAHGLHITSSNVVVRGLVIHHFSGHGIFLDGASGCMLEGNYIGTDAAGMNALGNGGDGIRIVNGPNNVIGGVVAAARNLISGNGGNGVMITGSMATNNLVIRNWIGTDATGLAALGNGGNGVAVVGASFNALGDGAFQVISGNRQNGVLMEDGGFNYILNTFIGVNAIGQGVVPNGSNGVFIVNSPSNAMAFIRSAGNAGHGVHITGPGSIATSVAYSEIGASPYHRFGNGMDGVRVEQAPGTIIGPLNWISTNGWSGIVLKQAPGTVIRGADIAGIYPQLIEGNLGDGVRVEDSPGVRIEALNGFAGNGGAGVSVTGNASTNVSIARCSFFGNAGLGIDLAANGVTANDAGDGDAGPNRLQNFPVLLLVAPGPGSLRIQGTLDSRAATAYTLDFYANAACDPSGQGEGQTHLGSTTVTTDASAYADFDLTLPATGFGVGPITATATDPAGNTSEFSACAAQMFNAFTPPPNDSGHALRFDGVNDYLSAAPPLLPAGNMPYTIEAWINTTVMNTGTIAAWGNFGVPNQVNAFRLTPTGLVNYWWANDLSVPVNLVGAWHHVAATFDGSTRRILVDGIVRGSDTPVGHNAGSGNFTIGSANGGEFFSGAMDEVRIWNVGRSEAQIREAMCRQIFGNEAGLIACYRFDEGVGLVASDATGYPGNTASLVNGPAWQEANILPWSPTVDGALESILSPTSAKLSGVGTANNSPARMFFQWGLTTSYGNITVPVDFGNGSIPGFWTATLTGLTPGEIYHARAVSTNAHGGSYGTDFSFTLPELPALSIRLGNTNTVILTWPHPSTGYVLQQTANMSGPGGGWSEVTQPPVVNGANNEVTLAATGRFCLFQLRKP